jgi:hypothetical protein
LSALELLELADLETEEFVERSHIDAVTFLDGFGADELLEHAKESLT